MIFQTGNEVRIQKGYEDLLDLASEMLLKKAMTEFGLSARAHDKICKVARTISDLSDVENIQPEHIAEAISFRRLDRKL